MKDVCDFTHLACEAHFKAPTLAFWLGAMFFGRFVFVTSDHIWLRGMECFVNSSTLGKQDAFRNTEWRLC